MKKTVIIADDNAVLVADLKEFFASVNDYDVVAVAENGKEALAAIEKFDPDFLLLDIVMPELDGFGVLSALTKPRPTVIMMSQLNTDAFVQKALRYGAKYFLAKPFDLGLLLRTLDDFSQENDAPAVHPRPVQRQSVRRDRSLDEKIANLFISVGIPAHIKGYQFLREAIKITVDDPEIINSITKRLYPSVAAAFNTTPSKVERAIRHAIEVAWNRGKIENINNIFGMKMRNPPTASSSPSSPTRCCWKAHKRGCYTLALPRRDPRVFVAVRRSSAVGSPVARSLLITS